MDKFIQSSPFTADHVTRVSAQKDGTAARDPLLIVADSEQEALLLKVALRVAGVTNRLVFTTGHTETVDYFCRVTEYADPTLYPLPRTVLLFTNNLTDAGLDLIEQISRMSQKLLIAVVSGSAEEKQIKSAYASGASCYLRKTEKPDNLVELLKDFRLWLQAETGRNERYSEGARAFQKHRGV